VYESRGLKPGNPKLAVAYLRVSTEDQHLGPEAQKEAIERWAKANGVEVVVWRTDQGVSGATPHDERPGLFATLKDLKTYKAGLLVVAKRDRLARDVLVAVIYERLVERAGARVVSAAGEGGESNDPSSMLMRRMVDAFAEYERAQIRSRTKDALNVKRSRKERLGRIPFGWRVGPDSVHIEPEPNEQATMQKVKQLREEGLSIREIAALGIRSRNGRPMAPTQVARILAKGVLADGP
jgi:DNA invertase Pin-like site-specific DNA recombinase